MFQYTTAGNVDVCAVTLLIRPDDGDFFHDLLIFRLGGAHQARHVVAVRHRHTAFPGRNGLDLIGIPALGCAGKVGDDAPGPGFGLGIALMRDDRGHQREVVGMRSGARTHQALQFGIGEVGVVLHVFGLDAILGINDDPRPGREGEPVVSAQVRRNARFQHLRCYRLEEAQFVRVGEARGIDGDQHVRRTVRTFVFDAFDQFLILAFDAFDLDTGFFGETVKQRIVSLVVAGGIEVEHLLFRLKRRAQAKAQGHQGKCGEFHRGFHRQLLCD